MGKFPNPDTQFKPGESGNPAGKPKGTKHLSTWIQDMLNDDTFELYLTHPIEGVKKFEGAPIQAIVQTAMRRAANGDKAWADWLANHGYGQRQIVEIEDPRKAILDKYLGGDGSVGESKEA